MTKFEFVKELDQKEFLKWSHDDRTLLVALGTLHSVLEVVQMVVVGFAVEVTHRMG